MYLADGKAINIAPLKIKYFREFMDVFDSVESCSNDEEVLAVLIECARICLKQFYPEASESLETVEDTITIPQVYEIIDHAAGIKIKGKEKEVKESPGKENVSWKDLDLAKIEAEVFLLGSWKNYEELELSISIPELMETVSAKRELDFNEKKFMAYLQGIDIEEESNKERGQVEWERMKARVFSNGKTDDPNDVLSLQGQNAKRVGFGIGMGLDYEDLR